MSNIYSAETQWAEDGWKCVSVFNMSIRSVVIFTDPSEEDLGRYTVEMSDDPNLSSSYNFTAEGKLS